MKIIKIVFEPLYLKSPTTNIETVQLGEFSVFQYSYILSYSYLMSHTNLSTSKII